MGEHSMYNPPGQGTVILAKLGHEDKIGARLSVNGHTNSEGKKHIINFSYDGKNVHSVNEVH